MARRYTIYRRETPASGASRLGPLGCLRRRSQEKLDAEYAARLVNTFTETAYGAGLCEDTESCAGIPGVAVPQVLAVVFGNPDRMLIKVRSGQLLKDYTAVADRLAAGLGVPRVRIKDHKQPGRLWIELLRTDPLDEPVMLPEITRGIDQPVTLAGCETGESLSVRLVDVAHIIAQGQTRSGKSRWTYGLLAQLARCADVTLCGSDITGLIARAFDGTRHEPFWASGSADLERHAQVLEQAVAEMDRRNTAMPRDTDVYPTGVGHPLVFVVIEELAGLLEAAADYDAAQPVKRTGKDAVPTVAGRIKRAYKRLMAEGAKAGMRVLILVQRAEAGILGAFARGQATLRISFRVEDADSLKMLHSMVDTPTAIAHATAEPARALVSGPGLPLTRVRAPHMPSYARFCELIREAGEHDRKANEPPATTRDLVPAGA